MKNRSTKDLSNFHIFISASLPETLERTNRAQDLFDLMVALIGKILLSSGTLVYGGHPSITPLIYKVAKLVCANNDQIKLFQLSRFRSSIPKEGNDSNILGSVTWIDTDERSSLEDEMTQMRERMLDISQAGIFAGGKINTSSNHGARDEYFRFIERHSDAPTYLIGLLQGETMKIIKDLEKRNKRESNSLSQNEINILRHSNNIDLISSLILADIYKVNQRINYSRMHRNTPKRQEKEGEKLGLEVDTTKKILVVDDRHKWLTTINTMLGNNYELSLSTNSAHAKKAFNERDYDLLILDKNLPEESEGLRLLKHFRELKPNLPAIILTSYEDVRSAVETMKLGAADYIPKSTSNLKDVLESKVEDLLTMKK